jgi:hypothetical protein
MTSGEGGYQGGQQGGPSGDPGQGWNAPPAPPAQYPGYSPAPAAPSGYGAPPAMERPFAVRAGIGAFIASLILSLIGSIVVFASFDSLVATTLDTPGVDPSLGEDFIRSTLIAGAVIGLLFVALEVMFLWFAWNGRNWARIVLWVLGGLSVVSSLASFGMGSAPGQTGFLTALNVFALLLIVAGIVLLAMKPANEWYRYRGWLRATGQGR